MPTAFSDHIATGKNLLALARDGLIFIVVLLLLFFPATLKKRLVDAGIREGEFMGMKWKAEDVAKTDATLNESKITIELLKKQLDSTMQLLTSADTRVTDPAFHREVSRWATKNESALQTATATQAQVQRTLVATAPMVRDAQQIVNTADRWGVVFGTDATLEKARYETGVAARKFGLLDAAVYLRDGVYRSVAVADSREEAEKMLARAKGRRSDAYIVVMSTWCPNAKESDGYMQCAVQ